MPRSILVPLTDSSLVGNARRVAIDLARKAGFDDAGTAKVGLIVTEATTNALRHGKNAQVVLRSMAEPDRRGIEVLAIDAGQGMADVHRCLQDGYSTAGTSGTGLGAIQRLSDVFDIYSQTDVGTILLAQIWTQPSPSARLELGAVCVPKPHEQECGDVWAWQSRSHSELLMVADGLGHGPLAAQAADEAVRVFESELKGDPRHILQTLHGPMRATRGASVAIAEIMPKDHSLRYAGVGNISGRILREGESRSLISLDGTLGHEVQQIREFDYPWLPGSVLVLHSDGLQARWDTSRYPKLALCHPSLLAGVLFRDYLRGRDDVTVVVARERASVA